MSDTITLLTSKGPLATIVFSMLPGVGVSQTQNPHLRLAAAVNTFEINHQNPRRAKKLARRKLSWFTRGIRRLMKMLLACLPLPPLWDVLLN